MYTLYLDFETVDPDLKERGPSYIWNKDFRIIGMAYAADGEAVKYTRKLQLMRSIISHAHTLVAHNMTYELSCIKWLFQGDPLFDMKWKAVFCTRIGSTLDNNLRQSHSLDFCARTVLRKEKDQQRFGRCVMEFPWEEGKEPISLPKKYHESDDEEYKKDTLEKYTKKATDWAMGHMDIMDQIAPQMVEEYAKNDVELCRQLHKKWLETVPKELYSMYSDMCKVVVDMRHQGVRVDLAKAQELFDMCDKRVKELEAEADGKEWLVNFDSPKQIGELFDKLGIETEYTPEGARKTGKFQLERVAHPAAKLILEWRKYAKIRDDFAGMVLNSHVNGRLHGEMIPLGAQATGRFSHKRPNLGQIPSRDKILGPMMRSLFLPEEGSKWVSLDFSAQEPRLYVHWAAVCNRTKPLYRKQRYDRNTASWAFEDRFTKFNCPMIDALVQKYKEDPQLDSHAFNRQLIEDTTGVAIDRTTTKTFALGKAYGKGIRSTAEQLGCSYEEALEFSKAFDKAAPYITMTSDYAQWLFSERKYIKTLAGRRLGNDGVNYRAYNYLIQGSAADQTTMCVLRAYYEWGIIPLTVVHDEINFSGDWVTAGRIKKIMEDTVQLEIPSYSDIGLGANWAEAKGK